MLTHLHLEAQNINMNRSVTQLYRLLQVRREIQTHNLDPKDLITLLVRERIVEQHLKLSS